MPSLWPRLQVPGKRLASGEHAVLKTVNAVLGNLGAPPLETLAEMFGLARQNFLCAFEDLDPYRNRVERRYCGPNLADDDGVPLEWPSSPTTSPGKRVLVQLPPMHPATEKLLEDLGRLDVSVIVSDVRSRRLPEGIRVNGRIVVSNRSISADKLRDQCDLAVCSGSLSAVSTAMTAGVPLLLLPRRPEDIATSRRVADFGAGVVGGGSEGNLRANSEGKHPDYGGLVQSLLDNRTIHDAARLFLETHGRFSTADQCVYVTGRIQDTLRVIFPT
jgi:UDP:flavonoid glycosyltransferase YjiC (YdhE family)